MNDLLLPAAALAVSALLPSCRGEEAPTGAARSPAIFGDLDIHLLAPDEVARSPSAAAVGSLSVCLAEEEGALVSVCSAFRVSPRHLLTAGHCGHPGLVFDLRNIARAADVDRLHVVGADSAVRLLFEGQTAHAGAEPCPPSTTVAHRGASLDFALLRLDAATPGPFIDLRSAAPLKEGEAVCLYAYPNGSPLASSCGCRASASKAEVLWHDCDSLPGSSGGLVVSASTGVPAAMHVSSAGQNEWSYFQRTGRFESVSELGARAGVPGDNVAVPLCAVVKALAREAPEAWREVVEAADRGRG